jgi:4,5-DOPA dioxygenase extradiol
MTAVPALFIGRGSPMNTLDKNAYTSASEKLGRSFPRPRATVAMSAHR